MTKWYIGYNEFGVFWKVYGAFESCDDAHAFWINELEADPDLEITELIYEKR